MWSFTIDRIVEPMDMHFSIESDTKPTLIAALRQNLPDKPSWSAVRRLVNARRVTIGGVLCIDEARRLSQGEVVRVCDRSVQEPPRDSDVQIHFIDKHIVVAEKPSGMITLRRKSEYAWTWARRNKQPTLDECVPRLISEHAAKKANQKRVHRRHPKLYPVHRLDRDSSGLIVFARNQESQGKIISQFANHAAVRKYLAVIPGSLEDQTIRSQFIRDRGDGLRGSTTDTSIGEHAITHFRTLRKFDGYSELECRLETGRTNQIRIHLAEAGHPICGDIKYRGPFGGPVVKDESGIRRLALHATELCIEHPESGEAMTFELGWPKKMSRFIHRLD